MARLFIKYEELPEEDLIVMVNSSSAILKIFYDYFENLKIPLDDVDSWGLPDGFTPVWDIYRRSRNAAEKRNLINSDSD